jgi:ATP dependent DNA ligase C terminal region
VSSRLTSERCASRPNPATAGSTSIAGFALDEGKWDGIYVGRRKGDDLIYAGKVDHGFDKSSAADPRKRLKPPIRKTQPYAKRIAHKGIWVEPKLLRSSTGRSRPRKGPAPVLQVSAGGSVMDVSIASGCGRTSAG